MRREVLPNGLTILVLPEPGSPFVSVGTMYRVGAKNEAAGTTGLAHYCEHMNFRATRRFPGNETTESITRRGGRWSGYTWIDQTWYRSTMEKDALDHLLALEADRMTEALYEPAAFDQERTSVLAELRSYDDPQSVLYDAVLAASFEIHPYRNNTIGYLSDVEGVGRDEAYRFYRRFYHPNNAVLAVASALPVDEVLSRVRERFGALPGGGESDGGADGRARPDRAAPRDRPQARAARPAHRRFPGTGASGSGFSGHGASGRAARGGEGISTAGEVSGAKWDTAGRGSEGADYRREYGMAGVAVSLRLQLLGLCSAS